MKRNVTGREFQNIVLKKFEEMEVFQRFVVEEFGKLRIQMNEGFLQVQQQFTEVREKFAQTHQEIAEVREKLEPLSVAFDTDSQTLLNHGRRIARLEKKAGFR